MSQEGEASIEEPREEQLPMFVGPPQTCRTPSSSSTRASSSKSSTATPSRPVRKRSQGGRVDQITREEGHDAERGCAELEMGVLKSDHGT